MGVDAAVERRKVPSQYIADQVFAAYLVPGQAHQGGQQIEFDGGKIYRRTLPTHGASSSVEFDIANGDGRRDRSARRRSAQDRADLIEFLKSLADEEVLHDPRFANPSNVGQALPPVHD